MRVFISWSGPIAKQVAEHLRDWLPLVLQYAHPWVSDRDIWKGSRWNEEVAGELTAAEFGIICLASGNLGSPWLLFEAGALAARLDLLAKAEGPLPDQTRIRSRVTPYLFQVAKSAVEGPLEQFQAALADKTDTSQLLVAINGFAGPRAMDPGRLITTFEMWWPTLEEKLASVDIPSQAGERKNPPRPLEDLVEEVLEIVRDLSRRQLSGSEGFQLTDVDSKAAIARLSKYFNTKLTSANPRPVRLPDSAGIGPWTPSELVAGFNVLSRELGSDKAMAHLESFLARAEHTPRATGLEALAREYAQSLRSTDLGNPASDK